MEILPHLYEEFGLTFLEKLRGMFSITIYDTCRKTLALARDRFGIKPLFYAPAGRRLGFASEIAALRELPDIDERIDRQAISDFTTLLYIPAPATFLVGVRALQPVRRLFESAWGYQLSDRGSRLGKLSAQATEVNVRLTLPNDFLFLGPKTHWFNGNG